MGVFFCLGETHDKKHNPLRLGNDDRLPRPDPRPFLSPNGTQKFGFTALDYIKCESLSAV
jgi:hypothetical protein